MVGAIFLALGIIAIIVVILRKKGVFLGEILQSEGIYDIPYTIKVKVL